MIAYVRKQRYLYVVFVAAAIAILLLVNKSTGDAKNAAVSADTAVYQALQYATTGFPSGKLEGAPSEVHGQLLSYDQAARLSLGSSVTLDSDRDVTRPAWIVVFQGKIIVHIQGSADGKIPPKDEQFSQMSVILDGETGEFLSVTMHSLNDELKTDTLPTLKLPSQIPADLPVVVPDRPTTIPEPTFVPPTN